MKKIIFGLMILTIVSCGKGNNNTTPEVDPPVKSVSVKVMTYNIYGARPGGIPDLQVIADVIKRADVDLVALQEVDKNTTRNQIHGDIAKKLGELTGMDFHFAKAQEFYGGEYGDAVLSRLRVKEKKSYNLEVDPTLAGERRSVARMEVEKEGKSFYFVSTHFDHLSDERHRIRQATDFVNLAKTFDKPVIVGADFNALPTSNPIKILLNHFTVGCANGNCNQFTYPTEGGNRTIDYVIYSPINAFTPSLYSVYSWANKESDHFPVISTFQLNF